MTSSFRRPAPGLILLVALAGCSVVFPEHRSPRPNPNGWLFRDVTKESGVRFRMRGDFLSGKFIPTMGGGAALADYDGDGNLDLFLVNQVRSLSKWVKTGTQPLADCSQVFRNRGDGTFENVTAQSGIRACGWGVQAMWADLDADGYPDLFVGNAGHASTLWRNNRDGTFTEVKNSGIEHVAFTVGAAALDADGDGIADLYVGNYVDTDPRREEKVKAGAFMTPDEYAGQDNVMYRGNGDLTFTDVTEASGTRDPGSKTIGAVAFDYDGDGKTDLYVSNDQWRNTLFHNEGGGRFRDVSEETGTGYPQEGPTAFGRKTRSGMGLVALDLDGDLRPDLFVTNYAAEPNTLYRNVEGLVFEESDRTAFGGDADPSIPLSGWGAVAADVDDDGRDDLVVSNGQILSRFWTTVGGWLNPRARNFAVGEKSYRQWQLLFLNESVPGTLRFEDASLKAGDLGRILLVGRGLATGDVDGDGRLDLVFNPIGHDAVVMRNEATGGRSLEILPLPSADRRTVLGTVVTIEAGARKARKEFGVVPSYASGSWTPLHFGIGRESSVIVSVRWPDGTVQDLGQVAAGAWKLAKGKAPQPLRGASPR